MGCVCVNSSQLLRHMFDLKMQVWAMEGAHESDITEREEKDRRSEQVKADLKSMVNEWRREDWSVEEWTEVEWIRKTLADPTWRFGQGLRGNGEGYYGWAQ